MTRNSVLSSLSLSRGCVIQTRTSSTHCVIKDKALLASFVDFTTTAAHSLLPGQLQTNEKPVTTSVNTYPYKAYMETILSYGGDSMTSLLQGELYAETNSCNNDLDPTADGSQPGDKEKKRPDIEQCNHAVDRSTTCGHFHVGHTHTQTPGARRRPEIHQSHWSLLPHRGKRWRIQSCNQQRLHTREESQNQPQHDHETHPDHAKRVSLPSTLWEAVESRLSPSQQAAFPSAKKTLSLNNYPGGCSWDWCPMPLSTVTEEQTHSTFTTTTSTIWCCPPAKSAVPLESPHSKLRGRENTYVESFKHVVASRKSAQLQLRPGVNYDNYTHRYTFYGFDVTTDMCENPHLNA